MSKRTDVDSNAILQAWNDGLSLNAISREYQCSVDMVKKRLVKLGVSEFSRSSGVSKRYVLEADGYWDKIQSDLNSGKDIAYLMTTYHMTKKRLQDLFERHNFDYDAHRDQLLKDRLIAFRLDNKSVAEMGALLGKSVSTVNRYLCKFGLTQNHDRTDILDEDVLSLWNNGHTINEIADEFSCSHDTIEKRLHKVGITCDRASGITRHFERSHEALWSDIKTDLDSGMSVSVVSAKYHMRYDSVSRLIEKHSYSRPYGRAMDYALWNRRMDFALSPDGLCMQKSVRYVSTEIKYLECIRKYVDYYGSLPTVRILSEEIGYNFGSVNEIVKSHDLFDFVDTEPSCGGVLRIAQELQRLGVSYEMNNRRLLQPDTKRGLEVDVWIPEFGFGIEVNPTGTHSVDCARNHKIDMYYHQRKSLLAEEVGIGLLHMYDEDFMDARKYQVFVDQLTYRKKGKIRIGARKCEVRMISNKISNSFLEQHHFQGGERSSSIQYGLYFDDILVSVLCIGKSRYTNHDYEIIRYCVHPAYAVSGGFAKLFHTFLDTLSDQATIISYMDLNKRFSSDNVYRKNGFVEDTVTKPDYVWAKKYGMPVLKRYDTMKSKLIAEGYDPNKTEVEIMRERGFFRIFGAGSRRYVYYHEGV